MGIMNRYSMRCIPERAVGAHASRSHLSSQPYSTDHGRPHQLDFPNRVHHEVRAAEHPATARHGRGHGLRHRRRRGGARGRALHRGGFQAGHDRLRRARRGRRPAQRRGQRNGQRPRPRPDPRDRRCAGRGAHFAGPAGVRGIVRHHQPAQALDRHGRERAVARRGSERAAGARQAQDRLGPDV